MPIMLAEHPVISVGDIDTIALDCTDWLDAGELLTGTPTITEVSTSDLTITNKRVSVSDLVIKKRSVDTGMAVQCLISGQQAGTYTLLVQVDTTTGRRLKRYARFTAV